MASRCPTCDGPCWGPFYPDADRKPGGYAGAPVYAAYGGRRAFSALLEGGNDPLYHFGSRTGFYAWILESDTYRNSPQPERPFFSTERLTRLTGPAVAAAVMSALGTLVEAVRAVAFSGTPCPTCGGASFVRAGARYTLRGSPAVETAARALYAVPSGKKIRSESLPFFTESFLYEALDKDNARSVLAQVHELLRTAGIEDVWRLMYVRVTSAKP